MECAGLPGAFEHIARPRQQAGALHTLRVQSSHLRNTQKTVVRARTINRREMKRFRKILIESWRTATKAALRQRPSREVYPSPGSNVRCYLGVPEVRIKRTESTYRLVAR